jgi:hypothetical protein
VDDSLGWIAGIVIRSSAGHATPASVQFLLRKYGADMLDAAVSSPRLEELRAAIESGLSGALPQIGQIHDPRLRCQWLGVFAEAVTISDDEQLAESVQRHLAPAIDGLEQLARSQYEPGEGLVGGDLLAHLQTALAFLTAFELTGRLPYSMLAEELLQFARRRWWTDGAAFGDSFAANASGAQLFCRLAALHRDPEYAAAAVVAPGSNYRGDAARIITALEPIARTHLDDIAEYGMALVHWFALGELPN